jgi:UDP-N-acetylglucosamine--N-acetylmuramyl-(pentapeptide) pyrophosphoryl-undecaprenol N-acetylglucosamine transferase
VPGVLIPFPQAADDHQTKNALFVEQQVGGAVTCSEKELNVERMKHLLEEMVDQRRLEAMHASISAFKQGDNKPDLSSLICKIIHR